MPDQGAEVDQLPSKIAAIVLCGGHSTRMGSDKAQLKIAGHSMLSRVLDRACRFSSRVILVGAADQERPSQLAEFPQLHWTRDHQPDQGPIAGLCAGLQAIGQECTAAILLSCDNPLIPTFLPALLADRLDGSSAASLVYQDRVIPIPAVFSINARQQIVREFHDGTRAIHQLLTKLQAQTVSTEELAAIDPDLDSLCNANTPASFKELEKRIRARG